MFCSGVVLAAIAVYVAVALIARRPILANTLGEWDCACGDMLIKTTRHVIWNPLRDRTPEIIANEFLTNLRAGNCSISREWCADALARHRFANWKLSYREDSGAMVSLYFKLAKYGSPDSAYNQGSVGAVSLQKGTTGWVVVDYSYYF